MSKFTCSSLFLKISFGSSETLLLQVAKPLLHLDEPHTFSVNFWFPRASGKERGPTVYLSGLREKHFGEMCLNAYNISGSSSATHMSSSQSASAQLDLSDEGLKHIARYIECFESRYNDLWLVFHHEGVSLSKLLYTVEEAENSSAGENASQGHILCPSKWWIWLKTTESENMAVGASSTLAVCLMNSQ